MNSFILLSAMQNTVGFTKEEKKFVPILEDLNETGGKKSEYTCHVSCFRTGTKTHLMGTSCFTHSVSLNINPCLSLQQCFQKGINTHFTDEEAEVQRVTPPGTRVPPQFC